MKKLNILLVLLPLLSFGQGKGIEFVKMPGWKQGLARAKAENKYIFVDCYATWCGPCKQMDDEVYTQSEVGGYFNTHFISVKVQVDKTPADDQDVRKWYRDAASLQSTYGIKALPTFLFFAPDGQPVHRSVA